MVRSLTWEMPWRASSPTTSRCGDSTRRTRTSACLRSNSSRSSSCDGADEKMLGGLNSFFLLVDRPEVYKLPPDPKLPSRNLVPGSIFTVLGALLVGLIGIFNFRDRRAGEGEELRP